MHDTTVMHKWNEFKNDLLLKYGVSYRDYVMENAQNGVLKQIDQDLKEFIHSLVFNSE